MWECCCGQTPHCSPSYEAVLPPAPPSRSTSRESLLSAGRPVTSPAIPGEDGGEQDHDSPWSGFDEAIPPNQELDRWPPGADDSTASWGGTWAVTPTGTDPTFARADAVHGDATAVRLPVRNEDPPKRIVWVGHFTGCGGHGKPGKPSPSGKYFSMSY